MTYYWVIPCKELVKKFLTCYEIQSLISVCVCLSRSLSMPCILQHLNSYYALTFSLLKVHFNIIPQVYVCMPVVYNVCPEVFHCLVSCSIWIRITLSPSVCLRSILILSPKCLCQLYIKRGNRSGVSFLSPIGPNVCLFVKILLLLVIYICFSYMTNGYLNILILVCAINVVIYLVPRQLSQCSG